MADYTSAYTGAEIDENLGFALNGAAKAWVNFNGTGTIAERDSYNVSSLTDNGSGDYTINFTNAFGSSNYGLVLFASDGTTTAVNDASRFCRAPTDDTLAGSFGLTTVNTAETALTDASVVNACMNGDLA